MKILFLSDDFPPKSFGGAGIITYNLACGLSRLGHELIIITTTQKKEHEGIRELSGLKVYDIYTNYPPQLSGYYSLYNPQVIKKVSEIINKEKPDVIHAHNIHHYLSYYLLIIARKYTEKVFLTTHDAMAFNYGKLINFFDKTDLSVHTKFSYRVNTLQHLKTARLRYNPFRNIFIKWCLNKYPKKIFSISYRLEQALNQNGIRNTTTIHYGIDTANWSVTDEEIKMFKNKLGITNKKVVFFGGRLSEAKGGEVMIDTLKELVQKDKNVILLIAGTSSTYSNFLLERARTYGIENNVKFTGWLSREEIKKSYAACDVCVTPSIYFDAFNLFNIEAGAASKPVVGTCFGGTPEIVIDNVTGRIVNPYYIPMVIEAISSILNDKKYADELGKAGNQRILECFTMDRYVSDTLSWYSG